MYIHKKQAIQVSIQFFQTFIAFYGNHQIRTYQTPIRKPQNPNKFEAWDSKNGEVASGKFIPRYI